MQHLIEEVTRRLVSKLPESKAYYSISDLHDFQLPGFIISRMELELRKNLADSIVPPSTDWANMNSSNVEISWDNFIKAIHEQVRLPQPFARSVIEVAVSDVLELLIQPRKNMADLIFGPANELTLEELRQAASYVTVYPYLPNTLVKYMHRKQLASLSKTKAKEILTQVDSKLTEKYTPLNWAQLFDSLFILLGDKIEAEVFRQFFVDKGRNRWADYFDKEKNDINRTRFIEILSLPELDGIEEFNPEEEIFETKSHYSYKEETQEIENETTIVHVEETVEEVSIGKVRAWGLDDSEAELNIEPDEPTVEQEPATDESWEVNREEEQEVFEKEPFSDEAEESEIETDVLADVEDESDLDETESNWDERKTSIVFEVNEEDELIDEGFEDSTSYYEETDDEDVNEDEDETKMSHEDEKSETISDTHSAHSLPDEDDQPIYKKVGKVQEEPSLADKIKSQEDVPFWKRFVSHDESPESESEEDEHLVYDEDAEQDTSDFDELVSVMQDMEDEFISDLFGGDQNAYVQAVDDISTFEYWEDVSRYVKDEIIRVGMIDPLSDTCIEFVDRLQNHFLSKHP
ncbi:hypothetical protein EP331_03115 [bacterium]|nr:MAG: hypothetical protein EP331_03115 [bacterium]